MSHAPHKKKKTIEAYSLCCYMFIEVLNPIYSYLVYFVTFVMQLRHW